MLDTYSDADYFDYDPNGNLTQWDFDYYFDGYIDNQWTWEFDEESKELWFHEDDDLDGDPEYFSENFYNEHGLLESQLRGQPEEPPPNTKRIVYLYTPDLLLEWKEWDTNEDGEVDGKRHFQHDEQGRMSVMEDDRDLDGRYETRWSYEYLNDGMTVIETFDDPADGVADAIYTMHYSQDGELIYEGLDENIDGKVDRIKTWEYVDGALRLFATDFDADGIVDQKEEYLLDQYGNAYSRLVYVDAEIEPLHMDDMDFSCWLD